MIRNLKALDCSSYSEICEGAYRMSVNCVGLFRAIII